MKSKDELKELTPEELQQRLAESYDEYENLKIQQATHQLANPMRIRTVRREIARIKTLLRQSELGLRVATNK